MIVSVVFVSAATSSRVVGSQCQSLTLLDLKQLLYVQYISNSSTRRKYIVKISQTPHFSRGLITLRFYCGTSDSSLSQGAQNPEILLWYQ